MEFIVQSRIKIGNRLGVTVEGDTSYIKNGDTLVDENGLIFKIVSIGMGNYPDPSKMRNKADLLIDGNVSELGDLLIK